MARSTYEPSATHTRVRLEFHSFNDGFSGVVEGYDPGFGRIVSCSTTKQFGDAAGSFTIVVKKPSEEHVTAGIATPGTGTAQSWTRLWDDPEGTWVFIQWICDGEPIDGMLGILDSVSESVTRQGLGERAEIYTLTGRDVGKVLEQTVAFVNVYDIGAAVGIAGIYQRGSGSISGPPGRFVEALLDIWIGNYSLTQPWRLPPGLGGGSFYDLLRQRISCKSEEHDGFDSYPALIAPDQDGKNLWSMLQEVCNGMMNELWIDLGPPPSDSRALHTGLVPTVTLRRKPFKTHGDHMHWDQLITHTLDLGDVAGRQIAKGGPAHRFNYWLLDVAGRQGVELQAVLQQHGAQNGRPGSIPIWNLASIEKHGLRKWQQSTPYMLLASRERGTNFARLAGNWLRRLHDWYVIAPMQLSGTVQTTRVMPEIRIGHRVREIRRDGVVMYYVEGVANNYAYSKGGQTTLTLTRGEYEGEELLNRVYSEMARQPVTVIRTTDSELLSEDFDTMVSQIAGGEVGFSTTSITDEGLEGVDLFEVDPARASEDTGDVDMDFMADEPVDMDFTDQPSPSEEDAARAYRGEQEQTIQMEPFVFESDNVTFDQEALETGEPIPVDPDLSFPDDDDPIGGLP